MPVVYNPGMVKETRVIFDLSDIKAVRLQCSHCGREAVQSVESTEVPKRCPFCNEDWDLDLPNGHRGSSYSLIRNIQTLLKKDTPLMTIRFEIDGEEQN